jgi:hypothetical protein
MVHPRSAGARIPAQRHRLVAGHLVGLFRHYWLVLKLGITVFATVILLIYM